MHKTDSDARCTSKTKPFRGAGPSGQFVVYRWCAAHCCAVCTVSEWNEGPVKTATKHTMVHTWVLMHDVHKMVRCRSIVHTQPSTRYYLKSCKLSPKRSLNELTPRQPPDRECTAAAQGMGVGTWARQTRQRGKSAARRYTQRCRCIGNICLRPCPRMHSLHTPLPHPMHHNFLITALWPTCTSNTTGELGGTEGLRSCRGEGERAQA